MGRTEQDETISKNEETGGEKATKPIRFDLIPPYPLWELARVYGVSAQVKYADRNWEQGYPWSWSISALQRHLQLWLAGERMDTQLPFHHLAQVMWHCCTLMIFEMQFPQYDDRSILPQDAWMQVEKILPAAAESFASIKAELIERVKARTLDELPSCQCDECEDFDFDTFEEGLRDES